MDPKDVVRGFWAAMETNDFFAAAEWLAEDFELRWPQSGEVMRGREAFGRVNSDYPAAGRWRFDLRRILAEGNEVVTEVSVTDGEIVATALTFHSVAGGKIARQLEYWPDPFPAPAWRAPWVELEDRT
jgi:ketosteroid isomerase-like protein